MSKDITFPFEDDADNLRINRLEELMKIDFAGKRVKQPWFTRKDVYRIVDGMTKAFAYDSHTGPLEDCHGPVAGVMFDANKPAETYKPRGKRRAGWGLASSESHGDGVTVTVTPDPGRLIASVVTNVTHCPDVPDDRVVAVDVVTVPTLDDAVVFGCLKSVMPEAVRLAPGFKNFAHAVIMAFVKSQENKPVSTTLGRFPRPGEWVEWVEPYRKSNEAVYMRMSFEDIAACRRREEPRYETDQEAVDDFVVVHWARAIPAP